MAGRDLKDETTETLMALILCKDNPDCADNAKEAFRVFTFRFQLDLLKKLIPICKNWGYDEQVATEIAYNTFERVWKYPKYDKSKSKQQDFDKGMSFYLYAIASHLLVDYKKIEDGEGSPFTGNEELVWDFPKYKTQGRKVSLADCQEHIKKLLDRLSPKHRVIYLTYMQYDSEIKEGHKLPRNLLKRLRTELGLTQNTVRAYKNEAFNKIESYLKTHGSK